MFFQLLTSLLRGRISLWRGDGDNVRGRDTRCFLDLHRRRLATNMIRNLVGNLGSGMFPKFMECFQNLLRKHATSPGFLPGFLSCLQVSLDAGLGNLVVVGIRRGKGKGRRGKGKGRRNRIGEEGGD
jgi:hypothetical protein